jgi:hypothetical protein
MNWKKLKERFPNSEIQIREHLSITKIQDSRNLINNFLESKGYVIGFGFIKALTDYEQRLNKME